MSAAEEAYATLLALEALAVEELGRATRDAVSVLKGGAYVDVEKALAALSFSFRGAVLSARRDAREAANVAVREALGELVYTNEAEEAARAAFDAERAARASAYYARAFSGALSGSVAWDASLDLARAEAEPALAVVAAYEVFEAWSDEHRRALEGLRAKGVRARWTSKQDLLVCPLCFALDGSYADDEGKFPGGVGYPPLHRWCRCFVVLEDGSKKEDMSEIRTIAGGLAGFSQTVPGTLAGGYDAPGSTSAPPLVWEPSLLADAIAGRAALGGKTLSRPLLDLGVKGLAFKAIDDARRTADFVASTDVIDSHGEIVDQASWQLADYLANPVVLFGHQSYELPIGKCLDLAVRSGRLECRIEFAPAAMNEMAERCWQMVRAGYLRALSVGFMPTDGRYEMVGGDEVWVWRGCVLKEISLVPVPANPEALAKVKAKILAAAQKTPPAPPPGPQTPVEHQEKDTMSKELELKIASLEAEKKAAAEAHERAAGDLTKAIAERDSRIATLETERAAFEAQTKTLAGERDAANEKVAALEAEAIEAEVDRLVGKKIAPAEKAVFVRLRKQDKKLFDEMIEQRQAMRLEEAVTPPAPPEKDADLEEFKKF